MRDLFPVSSDPTNADSVPEFDSWGPDFYKWSLAEWVQWHQANVAAYGNDHANDVFVHYWNQQSWGSEPQNDLTFDVAARAYLNGVGVLRRLPVSLGGILQDAAQALGDATHNLPAAGRVLGWLGPVLIIVFVVGYVAPQANAAKSIFFKRGK